MELDELFNLIVTKISETTLDFALVGGLAASLYRTEKRYTGDVDFAVKSTDSDRKIQSDPKIFVEQIISSLGYKPRYARKADLEGGPLFAKKRKSTDVYIIAGRDPNNKESPGVDFLLPTIPWVSSAIDRAKFNLIDYGFGRLPTITVEDLLIAKFYALCCSNSRPNDEDDVLSIFGANHDFDYKYLTAQMRTFGLTLPVNLEKKMPEILQKVSKGIARDKRATLFHK